jgi:hypothetical protein
MFLALTPETCRAKENISKLLLLHQVGITHYLLKWKSLCNKQELANAKMGG